MRTISIEQAAEATTQPTLTDSEKQEGWKLPFDGSTAAGWRGLGMEGWPADWVIENGTPLGHLILQDHHGEVFFRNIKIHVLPIEKMGQSDIEIG